MTNNTPKGHPKVIANISIVLLESGDITIRGYPNNLQQALAIFHKAENAIVNQFLKLAMEGKVKYDEDRIIKPGHIPPEILKKAH